MKNRDEFIVDLAQEIFLLEMAEAGPKLATDPNKVKNVDTMIDNSLVVAQRFVERAEKTLGISMAEVVTPAKPELAAEVSGSGSKVAIKK